jgi:hypothetical protein
LTALFADLLMKVHRFFQVLLGRFLRIGQKLLNLRRDVLLTHLQLVQHLLMSDDLPAHKVRVKLTTTVFLGIAAGALQASFSDFLMQLQQLGAGLIPNHRFGDRNLLLATLTIRCGGGFSLLSRLATVLSGPSLRTTIFLAVRLSRKLTLRIGCFALRAGGLRLRRGGQWRTTGLSGSGADTDPRRSSAGGGVLLQLLDEIGVILDDHLAELFDLLVFRVLLP